MKRSQTAQKESHEYYAQLQLAKSEKRGAEDEIRRVKEEAGADHRCPMILKSAALLKPAMNESLLFVVCFFPVDLQ